MLSIRNSVVIMVLMVVLIDDTAGAVCHTVQSGAWNVPANWDCGCDPASCDTLVIAHHMTATVGMALSVGYLEIQVNGSLDVAEEFRMLLGCGRALFQGNLTARTIEINAQDSVVSYGTMLCDSIWIRQGRYVNRGELDATEFFGAVGFPGMQPLYNVGLVRTGLCVSGHIIVNEGHWISSRASLNWYYSEGGDALFDDFLLHVSSEIGQAASLVVSDTIRVQQYFDSYGLIQCGTFVNGAVIGTAQTRLYVGSELVCGNFINQSNAFLYGPGSLCISGHSENHGVISAPISICDISLESPPQPPYMDVNTGGFLQPIYYCTPGSCATVGVAEDEALVQMRVRPVPAEDWVVVDLPAPASSLVLRDGLGCLVYKQHGPFTHEARLSRGDLPAGWYAVEVIGGDGAIIGRARLLFQAP